jgi:peptide/nickel transport system substrate-binding protein
MMRRRASILHMFFRWFALLSAATLAVSATRPHYGGTLRVEIEASVETADPPTTGPGMADLSAAFSVTRWEGGRVAVYSANENAPGGRPFLDNVEIQMSRPLRDQAIDVELKKADVVELGPSEARRTGVSRKTWTTAPVRLLALVFSDRVMDARVREALALAVDRSAIYNVLLQRQGEISGGLLPQWISGYAFLFPTAPDLNKARSLTSTESPQSRVLTLGFEAPALRTIAERIALNARDVGLAVSVSPRIAGADIRLVEQRITDTQAQPALATLAAALKLSPPVRANSPEELYAAERALLDGFHVIPLFHLPDVYGVDAHVKGGTGVTPLGQWRFSDLWLDKARP